ncbi:Septum formation protein Maf [uncultured archaeon]|nr:Septum formation protein Maf [uncultured archaeon]
MPVREPRARGKNAVSITRILAAKKAENASARYPRALVIAADTLLVCRKKIMGKPTSAKEAARMLERMSGQKITAITSICIRLPGRKPSVWSEKGWVGMREITPKQMAAYLQSGLWKGKAGAINIAEKPVKNWVEKKGGEEGAIVGLPVRKLRMVLRRAGVV